LKILVVDDDDNSRVFLERALRSQQYDVAGAANGHIALEKTYQWHPDLIVSDILMPGMNGFELCRRIKTEDRLRTIPFIFYTATFVDQKDEKLAMALGASRFLIKPMDPTDFFRAVREVIREYETNKLSVPDRPLAEMKDVCQMQAEALARKLDKKVRELETERKALLESEGRFRALTESTSDWIWEMDRYGVYTYSSPKIRDLLGYGPEDVIGKTPFDLMSSDEANNAAHVFKLIIESKKPFKAFEIAALHKGGRKVVLEKSGVPFFDSSGNLKGYRGIDRDITERKKLEEQLLQSQKLEAIGQFAGGIAHDFNNMLTVIMGYGETLKIDLDRDGSSQHYVDMILTSAKKAADLTQQILAFSRKQIISPKQTDLRGLIEGIEKLLRRLIGEDIEINITYADRDLTVMVDAGQLEQILMNLCTNARDAMPDGGSIFISTGTAFLDSEYIRTYDVENAGTYALITVTDTGKGMDEPTKQRIFEPFFTTKEIGSGTGLGLATAYGIIKQHKGHINVYSEPGKGSTFKIYLPLIESSREEGERGEVMPPERGSETILIAEDDGDVRTLTRDVLLKYGYEVIEAVDGEEAIDQLRQYRDIIRLVVMDVIMPRKSGKEVYDEIREIKPGIKLLFTSGYTSDIINEKGILAEGVDFISKPLMPQDLLRKIREILDKQGGEEDKVNEGE
jgi:PAS domain S-box-containing protein